MYTINEEKKKHQIPGSKNTPKIELEPNLIYNNKFENMIQQIFAYRLQFYLQSRITYSFH